MDLKVNFSIIESDRRSTEHGPVTGLDDFSRRLQEAVDAIANGSRAAFAVGIGAGDNAKQVAQQWIARGKVPDKYRKLLSDKGISLDYINSGEGPLRIGLGQRDPSQSVGPDDANIAQAFDLLYLMADARPEDWRLRRLTWPMVQVAAKAIQKAEGSQREAMAEVLAWFEKEY